MTVEDRDVQWRIEAQTLEGESADAVQIHNHLRRQQAALKLSGVALSTTTEVTRNYAGEEQIVEFALDESGNKLPGSVRVMSQRSFSGSGPGTREYMLKMSQLNEGPDHFMRNMLGGSLAAFLALVLSTEAKFAPGNSQINLIDDFPGSQKDDRFSSVLEHEIRQFTPQFQNRGVQVLLNNNPIIGPKPELESSERTPKPWDVPHGAPKPPGPGQGGTSGE